MPKKITFLLSSIPPFLCLVFFPWILLHILFNPSCSSPIFTWNGRLHPDDPSHVQLKAMVVGDLHLGGPTTMWLDRARRDSFMKASFKRAFQILKPHALLILGDISDWGRKSTEEQWGLVMRRFKDMVKPFLGLPYHVIVGNHDIGDYYQGFVCWRVCNWRASTEFKVVYINTLQKYAGYAFFEHFKIFAFYITTQFSVECTCSSIL
eukprot:c24245_g1_i2 orf=226-846(+)